MGGIFLKTMVQHIFRTRTLEDFRQQTAPAHTDQIISSTQYGVDVRSGQRFDALGIEVDRNMLAALWHRRITC